MAGFSEPTPSLQKSKALIGTSDGEAALGSGVVRGVPLGPAHGAGANA